MLPEYLDLAVAYLSFVANSHGRHGILRANHLRLDTQSRRNPLDTFGKTEIRRQKIQADVNHTFGTSRFRSARPGYTKPVKGGAIYLFESGRTLLYSHTQIHKLQRSHLSPSLLRFNRPSHFLPQSPALRWVRSVLQFLKGDSHTGAIFDGLCGVHWRSRVDNGYRVCVGPVEIGNWGFMRMFRDSGRSVESGTVAEPAL